LEGHKENDGTLERHKEEGGDDNKGEDEGEEKDGGDDKEEGGEEEGGDEGGDEAGGEEEEEEEEEEPVDAKPKLEEDCARSSQCAGYKHHYDECVERVTYMHEHPDEFKGHKEDCVEEFFHLQHCATQCAAPKLFKTLK